MRAAMHAVIPAIALVAAACSSAGGGAATGDDGGTSGGDDSGARAGPDANGGGDAKADTGPPDDGGPSPDAATPCATRITYGGSWIHPANHPAQYDDAAGAVTWDGTCTADGPSS